MDTTTKHLYTTSLNLDPMTLSEPRPRRHKYHIKKEKFRKDVRKFAFKCRVTEQWNRLPMTVAEAATLNSFKNKIDKLWNRDGIMYNPDIDIHTEMSRRNIRYIHIEEDDKLGDDEEDVN